ncbi:bifunctional folylpolyglutamate synthase/dihydrofolate synthase [Entomobacter blattae]|uniref:tetrahydrofolate synthase n=1 Tax=Entomobacter blattae TaxID=2762277 RepID=A0A7H1NPP3_9PROT|nr:folylpolyglutamate synthase/dihydrofolate synthase family protein [Entomobacter blattae]QNT77753.1 Dihydrofolate synthase/folylpolyglutamate synthase [Entomobacter blattae]
MSGSQTLATEFSGPILPILERLNRLYPTLIDLSLSRLEILLGKLGHPEQKIAPVIHIAGTNGKGSTTAHLYTIATAAGLKVHTYTSPHLVNITERFRLAGKLVDEPTLRTTLEEIEKTNANAPITLFEVLTAAAFLLFSRIPADLILLEVGLGGRFDATNVIASPLVSVITPIALDHENFLGSTLKAIAHEKAGIIKPGRPVVCARQHPEALAEIAQSAAEKNAPLMVQDREWTFTPTSNHTALYEESTIHIKTPLPHLLGPHQIDNAGLAIAALQASKLSVKPHTYAAISHTFWPARLQKLEGFLQKKLPPLWELWLDGGHNPHASHALARQMELWRDKPLHLILGMKHTKDVQGFIAPLLPFATSLQAVCEKGQHMAVDIPTLISASNNKATSGPDINSALATLLAQNDHQKPLRILICGSLYLAGKALEMDGWIPH